MNGIDFIKKGRCKSDISTAKRQEDQINYLTISEVQEDVNPKHLEQWLEKKFISNDYFLNWVKSVFKEENFKSFYRYMRYPLASSTLIRESIVPELERVFHADDSFTEYNVQGEIKKKIDNLDTDDLANRLFQSLMFSHNSIVVTKKDEEGNLKREFIPIKDVVSIEADYNKIYKVAYRGEMSNEFGEDVEGIIYVDSEKFEFYENKEGEEIVEEPLIVWMHEQDFTPVDFVSPKPFYENKKFAVRYSVFSSVRSELEEYVFLRTIQKMTEPNGAIPVVTKLKAQERKKTGQKVDNENTKDGLPLSSTLAGHQSPEYQKEVESAGSVLQAGTIVEIPAMKLDSGGLDMDAVQNFLKFFYIPTEALTYLNDRVGEIKNNIIRTVVGDYSEANEAAKNEKQVSKSFVSKQDKLRIVSKWLSMTASSIETKSLHFLYGKNNSAEIFFGSDFFIESKGEIYEMIGTAPNPIERRNLLKRLSGVNNKGNKSSSLKDKILYMLLPYATDKDFDKAIERGVITNEMFEYQTRFNYWVSMFEATYGSLVVFWESMEDSKEDERLITINNLIIELITNTNNNE